jgi:hypothetical protein
MSQDEGFIKKFKKQREKDILIGFPGSFISGLLEEMPGREFSKGSGSLEKFLEKNLNEPEFAKNFLDIFEDYARQQYLKDILDNNLKPLRLRILENLPGVDPEKNTDSVKKFLKRKLDEPESAEEFMGMYDDYASNGRVHIFFYRVIDKDYLKYLEENYVDSPQKKDSELVGRNILLWGSAKPVLVAIENRNRNGCNELWFKWVESRLWDERVKGVTPDSPPHFERRLERSVNYFIVDLDNGIAQLRIQHIKPNALKPLKEEYEIYLGEVEKLLDFKYFRRIAMESVVKNFLLEKAIEPSSWEMQLPNSGKFTAKGKPTRYTGFLRRIPLLKMLRSNIINRLDFFGRKLFCECQLKKRDWGPLDVKIKVDGEKDILTVLSLSDHVQMETIIERIMDVKKNKLIDKIMKRFFSKIADNKSKPEQFLLERIVLSFDYHFTRLEETEIKAGHLEDSEWLQHDRVHKAMDLLCQLFPKNFSSAGRGKKRILVKI